MSKYRITGPEIERITLPKRKRKGLRRGLGLIVLGGALFAAGLGITLGVSPTETSSRIKELKERLEQPVIESSLYLNQDYETERAELSAVEEEYDSLSEEREKRIWLEGTLPISIAILSVLPLGCGIMRYQNQRFREKSSREL